MKKTKLWTMMFSSTILAAIHSPSILADDSEELSVDESVETFNEAFAENVKNQRISNEALSKIRMEIVQSKLDQEKEKQKIALLKLLKEKADAEKQLNNVTYENDSANIQSSGGYVDSSGQYFESGQNEIEESIDEEYDFLSEKYNIDQNVGFLYKTKTEILEELVNSEEFKAMQKEEEPEEEEIYEPPVPVVTVDLESVNLVMLSVLGKSRSAKIKFVHNRNDGYSNSKLTKVVSVKNKSKFTVEGRNYVVQSITKDGVSIKNLGTGRVTLVTKDN